MLKQQQVQTQLLVDETFQQILNKQKQIKQRELDMNIALQMIGVLQQKTQLQENANEQARLQRERAQLQATQLQTLYTQVQTQVQPNNNSPSGLGVVPNPAALAQLQQQMHQFQYVAQVQSVHYRIQSFCH